MIKANEARNIVEVRANEIQKQNEAKTLEWLNLEVNNAIKVEATAGRTSVVMTIKADLDREIIGRVLVENGYSLSKTRCGDMVIKW